MIFLQKNNLVVKVRLWCRHTSSVDSSAPSILPPRVRVPSTRSTLFMVKFCTTSSLCWEKDENKQKRGRVWPIFKKSSSEAVVAPRTNELTNERRIVLKGSDPLNPRERPASSVTRMGEILPLWQNFKTLWQSFEGLFSIWQTFEPTLGCICTLKPNFHCCKWPNIEQII